MDLRTQIDHYRAPDPGRHIWTPPPVWRPPAPRRERRMPVRWSPEIYRRWAAPTYTSAGKATGTDDGSGGALASNSVSHAAGSLLVAMAAGGSSLTFTFSGGSLTWATAGGNVTHAEGSVAIGYAVVGSTASFAVTMTPSSNTTYRRIVVLEFASSTGWPASPLATYATGKSKTSGTSQSTNSTAAASTADNVVVAAYSEWGDHEPWTAGGSPGAFTNAEAPAWEDICMQYRIQTSAASANGAVTVNSAPDNNYIAACCAFNVTEEAGGISISVSETLAMAETLD